MSQLFHKHYTRDEARALLPQVRSWLERLVSFRQDLQKAEQKLEKMQDPGRDLGGPLINSWVHILADIKAVLYEFFSREIQIKDLDRGLIDFPALLDDKEVFLCWERGEEDIEFWHDLESGYAGRQRLDDIDV